MPGPIVHLQNVIGVPDYLRELGEERGSDLADLLDAEPCSPYAGFGAQGPDFLIFSLKEYGTPLDELVNFLFGVYDALEPFIEFYEKTIKPVEDAIDDAINAVDEALFDGIIQDIGNTADLISTTLLTYLAKVATDNIDFFYPFYPKVQQGKPENEWYWFDIWHYRRTGQFASNLWQLAQGDDDLMRYAVGYGTHIGGDVAGHPFVNAIVGGPYRSHWHRHHLVENWIDAWARRQYPDSSKTLDCLGLTGDDTYVADAISGSYYYRLVQFPDDELPGKLADLFVKAVDQTYSGTNVPATFSATDFDTTYRLWLMWFKRLTTIGSAKKPTPVPPPGSATLTLINDYVSGFPSFPGGGGSPSGGFSIWDIFKAVLGFVKWLVDSLAYTIDWIVNHASDIFTLPLTEAKAFVKWLLYQIQKYVWQIFEEARFALVLGAYLSPEPRDFARVPFGTAFINTASAGLTGGPSPWFYGYPHRQESHGLFGPTEHHLVYPGTLLEPKFSEAAPFPFYGQNPDVILSGWHPYDSQIEQTYDAIGPYGSGPEFTHWTDSNTWGGYQFGSLREFSARLLSQRLEDLPNFNLDGDRGYAWKTWAATEPDLEKQGVDVDVDYIDT